MYLEKLEIQGFKSFANKNELIFPGMDANGRRGITVVVGPNGSGKSNVADAIRWVMGEQSMKTLRGKKSEDVIFSGSDKRGRLGMAEVSLYFNNDSGLVASAGDSVYDEMLESGHIVITRRLYRDGASEYVINGSKVRLFDIQMLLAKANVGQRTYSVIGQGLVDGFLNTSLSERKEFFDEATGVRQYQIKRDDALNKLKLSLENLGQSQMLLNEIEPRLRTLTKQVAKLEKRESLTVELSNLQKEYYSQVWHELNGQLHDVNLKLADYEKSKLDKDKKIAEVNEELTAIENQKSVSEDFSDLQANVGKWQEQKIKLSSYLSKFSDWLQLHADTPDSKDLSKLEAERAKLASELTIAEEQVLKWRSQSGASTDHNNWQAELRRLSAERDRLTKDYEKLDAWLEMKLEAQGKFDLSFLNNRHSELLKTKHELELSQVELTNAVVTCSTMRDGAKAELEEVKSALRTAREELHQLGGVSQDKVVHEVSQHLEHSLSKLSSVEQELDIAKVKSVLAEIRVDLERVLALSTGQELRQKIAKLQDKVAKLGERQEACLHQISTINSEFTSSEHRLKLIKDQSNQVARDLVDIERKLKQAEDKFDAKEVRVSQAKITEELRPIESSLAELRRTLSDWQSEQDATRAGLMSSQARASELRSDLSNLDREINQIKYNQAKLAARLESAEEALKPIIAGSLSQVKVSQAELSVKQQITELEQNIAEAQAKLRVFNEEQERKRQHLLALQRSLQSLQQEVNEINNKLNDLRLNAVRYETRLEDLETEIRADYGELVVIKQYKAQQVLDKADALSRIKNLKHQLDQIGGIDPEVEKEYGETKTRFDFLNTQTNDLNDTIKSLEEIIKELDISIKERFDKEFKIIEEKFGEYFKVLFNGGSAKIIKVMADEMVEAEQTKLAPVDGALEVIELSQSEQALKRIKLLQRYDSTGLAGIEIVATPPGKKIQSIAMLSGGERALTAIALICAIISANPSPFVLLDEVDAALDESNSGRLSKILDDLSHKTQFIAITHNRTMMRIANTLYGVTMGDDSVSKLLSVKLEDIKD